MQESVGVPRLELLLSAGETALLAMKVTPAERSRAVISVAGCLAATGVTLVTPTGARRTASAVSCMVLDALIGLSWSRESGSLECVWRL